MTVCLSLSFPPDFALFSIFSVFFRLIQWNPATALTAAPAAAGDSSESSSRSSRPDWDLRYSDSDARRFKQERDDTRHELEVISKQAGIADLEWQHQRKQLLETIDGNFCGSLNFNLTLD